jgi:hypothetical protein
VKHRELDRLEPAWRSIASKSRRAALPSPHRLRGWSAPATASVTRQPVEADEDLPGIRVALMGHTPNPDANAS